ncbi:phosphoglycerate kinase [Xenorhabdus thuongxuanensis]|uniref:Phosphoglycerate kinase n=1 Tax=Xenorhabdus thuongxuanensis TaxID=1873484 RepID=A0A1Q5U5S0_9GAMM|nr:phosphoglycerate kinase [Xenorhabdus thuongxuanensis]OKP07816.1 phosphoglycerate kinase [Xenorhabdus thuongxuanensis]
MKNRNVILYSAGLNIDEGVTSHPRIDEEVNSLLPLLKTNKAIALINHQGDFKKNSAKQTPYIAQILSQRLQQKVDYFEHCVGEEAIRRSHQMQPRDIILFSNTRLYPEEQNNDINFAKQLSQLGNELIIGGFCKLHRTNASNTAIKTFLPWSYSEGVQQELRALQTWRKKLFSNQKTLLILGGNKIEKVKFLLAHKGISNVYKIIIGGLVLNSVLKAIGINIGRSTYFNIPPPTTLLFKIYIPRLLIVEDMEGKRSVRNFTDIKPQDKIIDFIFEREYLNSVFSSPKHYSFFAAGPLSVADSYYAKECYYLLHKAGVEGLFMGGDTLTEIDTFSNTSSGGGASLKFFSTGYQ